MASSGTATPSRGLYVGEMGDAPDAVDLGTGAPLR